jgi:hypothetical protein
MLGVSEVEVRRWAANDLVPHVKVRQNEYRLPMHGLLRSMPVVHRDAAAQLDYADAAKPISTVAVTDVLVERHRSIMPVRRAAPLRPTVRIHARAWERVEHTGIMSALKHRAREIHQYVSLQ